ncbi:glycosyltransferase [Fulvivirga sp. 29W222]|uniref:Glycosyltransferase n=1 Tax=Fulvivirga marina TaxID=2494733 RepID=A0A937G4E5_9BACT|nr:glycosyltransferase [Fulvivirga marina]MBL6449790.1 glycosyltransferase [Fulvivirga marina]
MSRKIPIDDILATIVLYNTSLEESLTFRSLSESLLRSSDRLEVLVYDNSPFKMHMGNKYSSWHIHYYHDPTNSGVSKAFNHGGSLAKTLSKKWLLLLDQDTFFPKEAINAYAHCIKHSMSTLFAPRLLSKKKLISPFKIKFGEGETVSVIHTGKYPLNQFMPINSGLLVNVEDFWSCGGYNESFPLDYSDFAFIERFRKIRPDFEIIDMTCAHQFSGHDNSGNKQSTLKRFQHFCNATLRYKMEVNHQLNCKKLIMRRAARLSIAYKSMAFIKTAILAIKNK